MTVYDVEMTENSSELWGGAISVTNSFGNFLIDKINLYNNDGG